MQISVHSAITLCCLEKTDAFYHGQGLTITYAMVKSPVGDCFIANSAAGIVYLGFPERSQVQPLLTMLARVWPLATFSGEDEKLIQALSQRIFALPESTGITLLVKGTPFQLRVWQALLDIPPAATRTYSDIARQIQYPQAHRAVGSAVGKNPVSYLVPCHRVLPKSGGVGNYLWGASCKEKLLAAERRA
jgi:AraC family transcriptional regulator of adaptative response/methylated-DNA-[protein]-cysteine methyltransferase